MLQIEIRVKGRIDEQWSEWFDGLTITHVEPDETVLTGSVTDQSALYGLLAKLRDPFVWRGLVPAALIAIGLAGAWYLPRTQDLFTLQRDVVTDWSGESYGFSDVPPSFWWYALTMPGAMSNVFAVFVAIGVVAGIVKRQLPTSVLVLAFLVAYG